ncbi:MAG: hypothetical protein ABWX71_09445, partial [Aeromicrobium sp.]
MTRLLSSSTHALTSRGPALVLAAGSMFIATSVWLAPAANAVDPPRPVGLGTAATYSVLGGSAITNTLKTVLGGDLGVSPGTAVDGFPPGVTNGSTHIGD